MVFNSGFKGLKNPLFPILWEDGTHVQECLHMVKLGVERVAIEPPRAPGYYVTHNQEHVYNHWLTNCIPQLMFRHVDYPSAYSVSPYRLQCFVRYRRQTRNYRKCPHRRHFVCHAL